MHYSEVCIITYYLYIIKTFKNTELLEILIELSER